MMSSIWYRALISLIAAAGLSKHVLCTSFIPPGEINLIFEPFVDTVSYRYISQISFQDCMKECILRSGCRSVAYNRIALVCGISDIQNITTNIQTNTAVTRANGIYIDVDALTGYTFGDCTATSCGETEKCEPSVSGTGFQCVVTECSVPQDTVNGHSLLSWSSLQVGASAEYECQDQWVEGSGSPYSTCLENGTWSIPELQCGVSCPEPTGVDTADFLTYTGLPWRQGTVLTYQCKPGFQTIGGFINATSICNSTGEWVPRVIRCCPDNWWLYTNGSCVIYYNGSTVTNIEEMRNVCTQQSAYMLGASSLKVLNDTRDRILTRYQINQTIINDVMMDTFTATDKFQALRDCMSLEGYTPSPTATYSYVILTARGAGLFHCPGVDVWTSNQPSDAGNCTVYGNPTDYLLKDVPCDWAVPGIYGFICQRSYHNLI